MHADEAVQAARSRDLWQHGRYVYRPEEFHGPTLQYATLPSLWISGADHFADTTKATYRIVPALFGIAAVLLLWLLADALGKPAVVCAGALLALSPAVIYYNRYYIHQTLLMFFTLAAMATAWRYFRSGRLRWCLAAGVCVGLMQSTKETAPLAYFAALVGLAMLLLWNRLLRERACEERVRRPRWHWVAALGAAVLVAVVLYSSFFTNMRGPVDGVLAYLPWLQRAAGDSPHVRPWYYYLHLLAWWQLEDGPPWSQAVVLLLAVAGFAAALLPKKTFLPGASAAFVRWLGFYTLTLTAVYSAVPYKTPWCLLQFLPGMILLAGIGAVALVRWVPTWPLTALTALVLLSAVGQLGWQSYLANYKFPADQRNPYVYVHTGVKFEELAEQVQELAEAWADQGDFSVAVVWHDEYYWPLPWYLRHDGPIRRLDRLPDGQNPAVVVASAQCNPALAEQLADTHQMPSFYEMRPNVFVVLWVRKDVWQAHLQRLGRL